jgi:glyoxylase-like metal-dependent hydrolase (beta-lactamase superfamily II)
VLSHHHFDHPSGIAAVVAEGSTIVMHESDTTFFERALAAPRTLLSYITSRACRMPKTCW